MVTMAAATSSTIPDGGVVWEPFWEHSEKQVPPMCQCLQKATVPIMGRATFRQTPCVLSPGRGRRRWIWHRFDNGAPTCELQLWPPWRRLRQICPRRWGLGAVHCRPPVFPRQEKLIQ